MVHPSESHIWENLQVQFKEDYVQEPSRSDIQKQLDILVQMKDERIFSFYLRVQEIILTTLEMKPLTASSTANERLVTATQRKSDFHSIDRAFFTGLRDEFKDYVML